jgi:hypothetical protein
MIYRYGQAQVVEMPVRGVVLDPQGRTVPHAVVKVTDGLGRVKLRVAADTAGKYRVLVTGGGTFALVAEAVGFDPVQTKMMELRAEPAEVDLKFGVLAKAEAVLTVTERVLEPAVDQRDAETFNKTLFTRDDQIFQTLGSGLSLGQHAGGGKSLEVRRFGFNLDHGGVGGGLRVMLTTCW